MISPDSQSALLIDGDNLTGQNWATLIERSRHFGHLAVARLYMDFQTLSDGGMAARSAGLEPVHVLGKRSTTGYKSMVDVALATDAMSILYENPNITTIIIGTGDADFIPLIRHWKRRGKRVVVMSNEQKLSGELRKVADELVTFHGGKKTAVVTRHARRLSPQELKQLVLEIAGNTRLTDRETNQPLIRVDWILEELQNDPNTIDVFPDEDALATFIGDIPELVPIDAKGRTYLIGAVSEGAPAPVVQPAPTAPAPGTPPRPSDDEIFEMFAEMCREVLPSDGAWMAAPHVLNEGKRLLEDGANLRLPRSRPTGWFRSLMDRTGGVEVRNNDRGHMEMRRQS